MTPDGQPYPIADIVECGLDGCKWLFSTAVPGALRHHVELDHPEQLQEWLTSRE